MRKLLTYGTADAVPVSDDKRTAGRLCIGDLIHHRLVDEAFCRQIMDATGLTVYDVISKDNYLKNFVPTDYAELCSDEFDRVVAHRFMQDRDDALAGADAEDQDMLIPRPNRHVVTLGRLRLTEFEGQKRLCEANRRKQKLAKLKEKVEEDLQKEVQLESGRRDRNVVCFGSYPTIWRGGCAAYRMISGTILDR